MIRSALIAPGVSMLVIVLLAGSLGVAQDDLLEDRRGPREGPQVPFDVVPGHPWSDLGATRSGPARPWESGIAAGTYTQVKLRTLNLHTAIPLFSLSGKGPGINVALFHNSVEANPAWERHSESLRLGEGWRVSYSTRMQPMLGSSLERDEEATGPVYRSVVYEDGRRDTFERQGGPWIPPPGVFDVLTVAGNERRITRKDQSYLVFDASGFLTQVVDALGHAVTVEHENGRISRLLDAAGREVLFVYDGALLSYIEHRVTADEPAGSLLTDRRWNFYYDADERLQRIEDPRGGDVLFEYDSFGRITKLTDKDGDAYEYTYDPRYGTVRTVVDPIAHTELVRESVPELVRESVLAHGSGGIPSPREEDENPPKEWTRKDSRPSVPVAHGEPAGPRLVQKFSSYYDASGIPHGYYTDRRGQVWDYVFNSQTGDLDEFKNPFGATWSWMRDGQRNPVAYTDPLNNQWQSTFDGRGNRLTLADPLTHTQTWEYDAYNNVTSHTDAAGSTVQFLYESPLSPTLLTKTIEPPVGQGAAAAETVLNYYNDGEPGGYRGALKEVIDPNGVWTGFTYDAWGQARDYAEGRLDTRTLTGVYAELTERNSADWVERSVTPSSSSSSNYSPGGEIIKSKCGGPVVLNSDEATKPRSDEGEVHRADARERRVRSDSKVALGGGMLFPALPCEAPVMPEVFENLGGVEGVLYTLMGRLASVELGGSVDFGHSHEYAYDHRGRVKDHTQGFGDGADVHLREWSFAYDDAGGNVTRTGPDGAETFVQYDAAGRAAYLRRGPAITPVMTAAYAYYDDNRVGSILYGNGASVHYEYDAGRRVTAIEHRDGGSSIILRLEYEYSDDDLPTVIREYEGTTLIAQTAFAYDARDRLIGETRVGEGEYDLTYAYDQGGNRLTKIDALNDRLTEYHYDIEDPDLYGSNNNRLMYYDLFDTSGQSSTLLSTTVYYYNASGNAERIVTESHVATQARVHEGDVSTFRRLDVSTFSSTRLVYARNGSAVSFVMGETWDPDGPDADSCPDNYTVTFAKEFRYDTGRARYMVRDLDTAWLTAPGGPLLVALSTAWTAYDGAEPYGDYTVSSGAVTETNAYEPGVWRSVDGAAEYLHNDNLGTLRVTTDAAGQPTPRRIFSAFGEPIASAGDRYGYVGTFGYQFHSGFAFLHVGARYYDPSTGRFLQRDPIGIRGGINRYTHVRNHPTVSVDPQGLIELGRAGAHAAGSAAGAAAGIMICSFFTIATGGTGGIIIIAVTVSLGYDGGDVAYDGWLGILDHWTENPPYPNYDESNPPKPTPENIWPYPFTAP